MKKKNYNKKLNFEKETIANLSKEAMFSVNGGTGDEPITGLMCDIDFTTLGGPTICFPMCTIGFPYC